MNSTVVHNSSKIRTVFALDWSCMELLTSVITCLAFFFVVEREVLEYKYRICPKENVYKPIKTTLIKKFSFVFFFGGGVGKVVTRAFQNLRNFWMNSISFYSQIYKLQKSTQNNCPRQV